MTSLKKLRTRRPHLAAQILSASALLAASLVASALFGSLPARAASEAVAARDLNVRTGPGPQYERSSRVPAGAEVSVRTCLAVEGWCRIDWAGGRGWVAEQYLVYSGRTDRNRRQLEPNIDIEVGVPMSGTGTADVDGVGVNPGGYELYGNSGSGYDRGYDRPVPGGADGRWDRRGRRDRQTPDPLDDARGFPRPGFSDGARPDRFPASPQVGRNGRRDPSGNRQDRYDQGAYDRDRYAPDRAGDDRTGLFRSNDDDLRRGDPRNDDRPGVYYRSDDDRDADLPALPLQRSLPSGTRRAQRQVVTEPGADSTGVTGGSILNSRPLIQDGGDLLGGRR